MAQYTVLTQQELSTIFKNYNNESIESYKVLSGGSENTNYLIISKSGKYVLSVCEQKSAEEAYKLAQLLQHLENHHFKTSQLIHTKKNEVLSFWKDKPVMLKKFIEGKIMNSLPNKLITLLGQQMGELHKIGIPDFLPKVLSYGKEQFGKVKQYAANSTFDNWLNERLQYVLPHFSKVLPKVIIHSDVFCDNVIVHKNDKGLTIMDFEEAAHYYRIFDIGMAIIGVCAEGQNINYDKARHLLNGYQQEVTLLNIEKESLQAFSVYAGTCMTFWRHQHYHYIKPDPTFHDHYQGLQVLVDDIEAKEPKEFLEMLSKGA